MPMVWILSTSSSLNTSAKPDIGVISLGSGTLVRKSTRYSTHACLREALKKTDFFLVLGYCKRELLPNHRGFDSFFGQWSHVVDYYSRISPVKKGKKRRGRVTQDDPKIGYDLHENDDISTKYEGYTIYLHYLYLSTLIIILCRSVLHRDVC